MSKIRNKLTKKASLYRVLMAATDAIVLLIGSFIVDRKVFDLGNDTQLYVFKSVLLMVACAFAMWVAVQLKYFRIVGLSDILYSSMMMYWIVGNSQYSNDFFGQLLGFISLLFAIELLLIGSGQLVWTIYEKMKSSYKDDKQIALISLLLGIVISAVTLLVSM